MAKGKREEGHYWRWKKRGGAMGGYQLPVTATAAVLGPYQPNGYQSYVYTKKIQLSYPKPRLRWTPELHQKFVEAINQLGGEKNATPKTISHIMRVEGVTLFHIKSHLQKFRDGKIVRRLLKRDFVPLDFSRRRDESLPHVNLNAQGISMSFDARNVNGDKTLQAENYGNLHLLVEPQTTVKNMEIKHIPIGKEAAPSVNIEKEEIGASKPALLSLYSESEWSQILDEVDKKPLVALTDNAPPMDDSLGYYSSEFALAETHKSSRASMMYGSFFDEVASFSKVDYDDFTVDHNVPAMEDDGVTNHYM